MKIRRLIRLLHLCILPLLGGSPSAAKAQTQPAYVSAVDQELSLKTLGLVPLTDNVSGIYARPLNESLKQRLSSDPRWTLVEVDPQDLPVSETKEQVQSVLKKLGADGVLTGRILKGPSGINLKLNLFVGPSGEPLLVEEAMQSEQFSTESMERLLKECLQRLRDRLPYHGVISSRRGQQVTFNLGKNSGLRDGDTVDVIQILKLNRHPKLRFMISTEKEILGKAKIFKADEELSFANLVFEKEPGVVTTGLKVLAPRPMIYPDPFGAGGASANDKLAFGEKPVEWLPEPAPQYGRLQVLGGIGQYTQNSSFRSLGGIDGSNFLTPNLGLMLEGWLNKDWWVGVQLRQSAFSIKNNRPSSTPKNLNMTLSQYDLSAGYNFLLGNDFFGPKLQISLGLAQFGAQVDESNPLLYSDMKFGGTFLGFNFMTNLGEDSLWEMGARLKYFISPDATDSADSGSIGAVGANDFSFLVAKRIRTNFRYVGELNFQYYSADFKNNGTRPDLNSNSHRTTTAWFGLEYSF